jgi:hypothetical protein
MWRIRECYEKKSNLEWKINYSRVQNSLSTSNKKCMLCFFMKNKELIILKCCLEVAEGGGFEPSGAIHPAAFEAAALPLC